MFKGMKNKNWFLEIKSKSYSQFLFQFNSENQWVLSAVVMGLFLSEH